MSAKLRLASSRDRKRDCENRKNHTPCPTGYLAWHAWAEEMAKTHRQRKCPNCGLYAIWVPKLSVGQERER